MILPETEYCTKQCRMLTTTNAEGKTAPTACVGSACAHWRWSQQSETKAFLEAVAGHMRDTGDNFNKATQAVYAQHKGKYQPTDGYCGLAGVPK